MATNPAVPTLSPQGWIEDTASKADRLISYYFASNQSQSLLYSGSVQTLQYAIAVYGSNPSELQYRIQNGLDGLLTPYFDNVDLRVIVKEIVEGHGEYDISVDAGITENDTSTLLGHLINVKDGTLIRIVNINNGRTLYEQDQQH